VFFAGSRGFGVINHALRLKEMPVICENFSETKDYGRPVERTFFYVKNFEKRRI
jgi:hypothetical protein